MTLSDVWEGLSWLAIAIGVVLAIVAPNGFLGVLIALVGLFSLWGWIEHEEKTDD